MEVLDRAQSEALGSFGDGWVISRVVTEANRRAVETVMTVGGLAWAVRDLSVTEDASRAATFVAGCYDHHAELMSLRPWTLRLTDTPPSAERVRLDLRHGVLDRAVVRADGSTVTERRFVSAAEPYVAVQRLHVRRPTGDAESSVADGTDSSACVPVWPGVDRPSCPALRLPDETCGASIVVSDTTGDPTPGDATGRVRVAALAAGVDDPGGAARQRGRPATAHGAGELEHGHRREWDRRWAGAGTEIDGDPALERSVRFATYRLLELAVPSRVIERGLDAPERRPPTELALGARGLTGTAYRGHVFWDTDVFALPALSSLAPATARRLLDYRWNRLATARARARADGDGGARFPWESARRGEEVTPTEMIGLDGRRLEIHTGRLELHITADIAWSVWNHVNWSGDEDYLADRGLELLVGSARYWASRLEVDADGSAHLRDVIGPDEYHVHVDDNTFTNVMVRHNLRVAARVAERFEAVDRAEFGRWLKLADAIVDGFDPVTGRYEQFTGYFSLDDVLAEGIAPPPMSADALVGTDVIQRIQVIKQPDVLMAYHLVPHLMDPASFESNLDHYHPRTAHGSSLSPAISAACLLRAGRTDEALRWLRLAADLDLENVTGTTPGGLHLATIGGVWQAITIGLLGLRARERDLTFAPAVPLELGRVRHRFGYRGQVVTAVVDGDDASVESDGPIALAVGDERRMGRAHRIVRREGSWRWA